MAEPSETAEPETAPKWAVDLTAKIDRYQATIDGLLKRFGPALDKLEKRLGRDNRVGMFSGASRRDTASTL